MPSSYRILYQGTLTVGGGDSDLLEVLPSTNRPCRLTRLRLSQLSRVGDAQEVALRFDLLHLGATVSSGTGGVAVTPVGASPGLGLAATFLAECNNTTLATTSGTTTTLETIEWNVRNGPYDTYWLDDDLRMTALQGEALVVRSQTTPPVDIAFAVTFFVQELPAASVPSPTDPTPAADPIILEDFSNLRTNALLPTPEVPPQPVWYPQIGLATPTVASATLSVSPTSGSQPEIQLYFRSIDNNGWYFLRQWIESGTWADNTYNRLRLRVKQVGGALASTTGRHNTEMANFLHNWQSAAGPMSGSDQNNWHFYHFFDIPADGLWYMVIMDTWPDHQRNNDGSLEEADQNYPDPTGAFSTNNINKRYFDLMSAFYWDVANGDASALTGTLQLRQYSFFAEDNSTVPLQQVRSVNGAYDSATTTVKLGWMRRKDEPGKQYTVRYSFAPITTFSSATLASTFNAPSDGTYNGVHTTITDSAFTSHANVWVAVQPQGSSLFRQWYVPLS